MDPKAVPTDEMDHGLLRRGGGLLPVVGLGASAGGLSALKQFFAAMPGMAFVVVMHLIANHLSALAEIFHHSTDIPEVVAADGLKVDANSAYVIAPGKFLASVDGHLSPTDPQELYGKRVAVDYFFRTLAETHGAQALAVVLSGMGSDGTLGLKRIKELSGLTIAQDPDEAEYADMPRSAIAIGVVDWVLPANEMPARLLAYVKQRAELQMPAEEGPHPAETLELSTDQHELALREVLSFCTPGPDAIFPAAISRPSFGVSRVAFRSTGSPICLPTSPICAPTRARPGRCCRNCLFRGPIFSAIRRHSTRWRAVSRTCSRARRPNDTVRVCVAGCATGEEAYSIAILLCEHSNRPGRTAADPGLCDRSRSKSYPRGA